MNVSCISVLNREKRAMLIRDNCLCVLVKLYISFRFNYVISVVERCVCIEIGSWIVKVFPKVPLSGWARTKAAL